jgi:tetratricopeptide (TPR) repeat protein
MFANKSHAEAYQFQLKKQYQEALEIYNQALIESPEHADCHADRAFCYLLLGKINESIKDFSAAILLQPHYGFRYSCRGFVYQISQQAEKASADYNKALSIDPRDTIASNNAPQLLQKSTVPLVNPAVIRAKILSSYLEFQKRFPTSEEQKKFMHFFKNGAQNK